jgi:hypothetical protein
MESREPGAGGIAGSAGKIAGSAGAVSGCGSATATATKARGEIKQTKRTKNARMGRIAIELLT